METNKPKRTTSVPDSNTTKNSNNDNENDISFQARKENHIKISELLNQFDWKSNQGANFLETALLDELANLETANIGAVLETDAQVSSILSQIDLAIKELDDVDNWLTLYKTELDSFGDDMLQIQTLNEGLQLQRANQKKLLSELEVVLGKVAVPENLTDVLRETKFETEDGLKKILTSASFIQRCLKTNYEDGVKEMSVINEQLDVTIMQSNNFSIRVFENLKMKFMFQVDSALNGQGKGTKLRIDMKKIKEELSKYRGLTLWLKEMDPSRHNELQQAYASAVAKVYDSEYKGLPDTFRSLTLIRKISADDVKYLFTGGSTNAKLGPTLHRRTGSELPSENKTTPEAVLSQILKVIIPDIIKEQNFFCMMFHIGGTQVDFQSWVNDWSKHHQPIQEIHLMGLRNAQKDVKIRKRILENMETMFTNISTELGNLGELLVKYDWTLLATFLTKLESFAHECNSTNQEFILKIVNSSLNRFRLQLDKNVDEQVKAINDLQVTGKKRRGILSYFYTFPEFLSRMETLISGTQTPIRTQMDKSYQKIVTVMFENLEFSAKQSEQDEKEQLNLHIITLENMHHFYTETRAYKKLPVMGQYNDQAKASYSNHLQAYIKDVIRRPIGKLLEFFEGVEILLQSRAPQEIGFQLSYNKSALRKVISQFPPDEVRKSIVQLFKRINKHFSEEDGLLQVVWRETQEEFIRQHQKIDRLLKLCYPDTNVELEFSINDLLNFFSRIAKSH